jgi:hypothetical protein
VYSLLNIFGWPSASLHAFSYSSTFTSKKITTALIRILTTSTGYAQVYRFNG